MELTTDDVLILDAARKAVSYIENGVPMVHVRGDEFVTLAGAGALIATLEAELERLWNIEMAAKAFVADPNSGQRYEELRDALAARGQQ